MMSKLTRWALGTESPGTLRGIRICDRTPTSGSLLRDDETGDLGGRRCVDHEGKGSFGAAIDRRGM